MIIHGVAGSPPGSEFAEFETDVLAGFVLVWSAVGLAPAAMDAAADLGGRFGELGETDPLGFEFEPTWVGFRRVHLALDAGEPDRAVSIAEGLHPALHGRAHHWVGYGRALARLRGRREDAVRALRRAETMNPVRVRRAPFVRDTIAVLLQDARRNAAGQELRDLAARAGLPG